MNFEIDVKNFRWLGEENEHDKDLCLHGNVFIKIGDTIIDNGNTDEWTVSAGAYRMLESLYADHTIENGDHMLPCCGHFMVIDENLDKLIIGGCCNGIDWTVLHENEMVRITDIVKDETTIPFEEFTISIDEYREIVLNFADEVKAFYDKSEPKFPDNDVEIKSYIRFWEEWNKLRNGSIK